MYLSFLSRTETENRIKNLANVAGIIFLPQSVSTEKGKVEMIGRDGVCMQDIDGDWVVLGTISDLNDRDYEKVYNAVLDYAESIMQLA